MDKFDLYVTPLSDGGPAFPVFPETGGGHASAFQGMTLRDYFAAKAMQSLINEMSFTKEADKQMKKLGFIDGEFDKLIAKCAYDYADAMLKARNK
jgi:hypothetical protein